MRFLLLSDTHGKLGIINELAAVVRADAVIHAGDFGFYDDGSYERRHLRRTQQPDRVRRNERCGAGVSPAH